MGRFSFALVNNFPRVSLIEPSASYTAVLGELFNQEQVTIVTSTLEEFFEKNSIPDKSIFFNFHLLHHLTFEQRRDYFTCLRKVNAPALFIEPNPFNPLIILQLLLYPDMRMKDEWQYLTLTRKRLAREFTACGLELAAHKTALFFTAAAYQARPETGFLQKAAHSAGFHQHGAAVSQLISPVLL